jgi:hypothetical protein
MSSTALRITWIPLPLRATAPVMPYGGPAASVAAT